MKEPTTDQLAFDQILETYYDEEYDSALTLCQNFLSNHIESSLIPRVKYNMAYILREIDRDEEAIPIFINLLESNYDEQEKFGGLMEQYALYKHRSASNLADIYLNLKNYELAKKYIRLFDKKYKYQHFGGNELMAYEIYSAKQYARLYHGQGKIDKAIKKLLPYIFYNGLASNSSLLNLLEEYLLEKYSRKELSILINQAKSTLVINTEDEATIIFLKTKIEVLDYHLFTSGNVDIEDSLKLKGQAKWNKAFDKNEFFAKYL
ncbi:tetratricopeptide repeat protein [Roseivirga sp. 4D4]|uniref:tetratricopeptide repeat protein n=1 Tax=Roseivirga sp. 4D4 TaxID=1889784 RepID=UPI001C889142|nr:hypothetical protein [Roseivirga sp. 4D4]